MSNIIIKGKNLNDINQSNFQTVGPGASFYFTNFSNGYDDYHAVNLTNAQNSSGRNVPNNFIYGSYQEHLERFRVRVDEFLAGKGNLLPPITFSDKHNEILKNTSLEPWSGRLHIYETLNNSGSMGFIRTFEQIADHGIPNTASLDESLSSYLFYNLVHTGDVYDVDNKVYTIDKNFLGIENDQRNGIINTEKTIIFPTDDRFDLGTYTENNKQYWELQTSDEKTFNSQFSQARMRTAQSTVVGDVVASEEEKFSVDAFVFTNRDDVITPLFFYYDKKLHNREYNLATNGKVGMKIELRESGRDFQNNIDLYQERKVVRPFLLGYEKDEQDGGTGEISRGGLFNEDTYVFLNAMAEPDSYLLGIFDLDENLIHRGNGGEAEFSFIMPPQDLQYQAKFRPNPLVKLVTRADGIVGGSDAKGQVRLWESRVYYDNDESEYYTDVKNQGGKGEFRPVGSSFQTNTLRPSDNADAIYTAEFIEITDNYKFRGWNYLSGSDAVLTPLPQLEEIHADEEYGYVESTPPGSDRDNIRTFRIVQDFRYPNSTLLIYAEFGMITFAIKNLNNENHYENDLGSALKYGPFKFVSAPSKMSTDYSFDDIKSYPGFTSDGDVVRLFLSAPDIGYSNSEFLPSGSNAHLIPFEESGYLPGNFIWHKEQFPGNPQFIEEVPIFKSAPDPTPPTLQDAINFSNAFPPTYNTAGINQQITGNAFNPSPNYEVGDTAGPGDIFVVTSVTLDQAGSEEGNYFWDVDWGPNFTISPDDPFNFFSLDLDETIDYQGIALRGDIDESTGLLSNDIYNRIISNEFTSSISYQPEQRGIFIKQTVHPDSDDPLNLTLTGNVIRDKINTGIIDANMYEYGSEINIQVQTQQGMNDIDPPIVNVFVYDEEDDVMKRLDEYGGLLKTDIGINYEFTEQQNFGTLTFTLPENKNVSFTNVENVQIPFPFKYMELEFRAFLSEMNQNESVPEEFHTVLSAIDMPQSGGTIEFEDGSVFSSAQNFFPKSEFPNFYNMTATERTITLRARAFEGIAAGQWSILVDPGVDPNSVANLTDLPQSDGTHLLFLRINQPGNFTISYNWEGDGLGGGF